MRFDWTALSPALITPDLIRTLNVRMPRIAQQATMSVIYAADYSTLQSAVNDATRFGGSAVILPRGETRLPATSPGLRITDYRVSLLGPGAAAATLTYAGLGDAIRIQPAPFSINTGGTIGGFTLSGEGGGTSPGTAGCHVSEIIGLRLVDLVIQNFTSGSGLWFENVNAHWIERTLLERVWLANNAINWRLTTDGTPNGSSFGYTRALSVFLNTHGTQVGVSVENNGSLYHSLLNLMANTDGAGQTFIQLLNTASIIESTGLLVAEGPATGFATAVGAQFRFDGTVSTIGGMTLGAIEDSLRMAQSTPTAVAPGAGYASLRWETGTNAGTAKLVARAGTSSMGTTVIDNVGAGF